MILRSLVIFCALIFSSAALVYAQTPPEISTKEVGQQVRPLLYSFVDFNFISFGDKVADDFVPNKVDLLREVSESFYKNRPLNLDILSGEVKDSDGKKIVSFKWQKSVIDGVSRKMVNTEGVAEFVFINMNNQWLLFQINGDSPFKL